MLSKQATFQKSKLVNRNKSANPNPNPNPKHNPNARQIPKSGYEAVSGWDPNFDLGPKIVYFGETYFKDQNSDIHIFGLITKI